jgi:hypothetical protein
MLFNKKIIITLGLASIVTLVAFTSMAPADPEYKNLKVLPKHITHEQLGKVMGEWERSLGVNCGFCHARDTATKKTDFASDAKPEKEMARKMFTMMNKINEKYFEAKKDSIGMVMHSGVNCNTCHNGVSHPEVKVPEGRRRGAGPGPGPAVVPGNSGGGAGNPGGGPVKQ